MREAGTNPLAIEMERQTSQDEILRDVLRTLRRHVVLIVASVVIAGGAALVYSLQKDPVYQASAEVRFNQLSQDLALLGTPAGQPLDVARLVAADAEVVTSREVLERVAKTTNADLSTAELRDSVGTSVDPDTNLLTIRTTAGDAETAAELANGFALQTRVIATRNLRSRLERAVGKLRDSIKGQDASPAQSVTEERIGQLEALAAFVEPVSIASPARVPSSPASPKPLRNTLFGAVLGLIFGVLAAFLRESLDRRLTDGRQVQHAMQIPTLGYVPDDLLGPGATGNGTTDDAEELIEPFRILRSNVEFLASGRELKSIAVTSSLAEEGKSTVAAGLARASALAGKQVLLVECDLRRPVFAKRYGLPGSPGLSDWASGNAKPAEVLRQTPSSHLQGTNGKGPTSRGSHPGTPRPVNLIPAGTWTPLPTELLGSERFSSFLRQVQDVYDLVILDCAPLLPVGDTLELIPLVDAAIICVRLRQTTREEAVAAKSAIEHFPPRPTGIVITGARASGDGYYYGYYSPVSGAGGSVGGHQ